MNKTHVIGSCAAETKTQVPSSAQAVKAWAAEHDQKQQIPLSQINEKLEPWLKHTQN